MYIEQDSDCSITTCKLLLFSLPIMLQSLHKCINNNWSINCPKTVGNAYLRQCLNRLLTICFSSNSIYFVKDADEVWSAVGGQWWGSLKP